METVIGDKPHKRLIAWQRAIDFVEAMYRLTERFPKEEQFGLVAQLRRASVSIASNIAEGAARKTTKEHIQFFYVVRGSVSEVDTQIEIAHRLNFISSEQRRATLQALDEIARLMAGLIRSKQA